MEIGGNNRFAVSDEDRVVILAGCGFVSARSESRHRDVKVRRHPTHINNDGVVHNNVRGAGMRKISW